MRAHQKLCRCSPQWNNHNWWKLFLTKAKTLKASGNCPKGMQQMKKRLFKKISKNSLWHLSQLSRRGSIPGKYSQEHTSPNPHPASTVDSISPEGEGSQCFSSPSTPNFQLQRLYLLALVAKKSGALSFHLGPTHGAEAQTKVQQAKNSAVLMALTPPPSQGQGSRTGETRWEEQRLLPPPSTLLKEGCHSEKWATAPPSSEAVLSMFYPGGKTGHKNRGH